MGESEKSQSGSFLFIGVAAVAVWVRVREGMTSAAECGSSTAKHTPCSLPNPGRSSISHSLPSDCPRAYNGSSSCSSLLDEGNGIVTGSISWRNTGVLSLVSCAYCRLSRVSVKCVLTYSHFAGDAPVIGFEQSLRRNVLNAKLSRYCTTFSWRRIGYIKAVLQR